MGRTHPHVATSLNNLPGIYDSQEKYAEAEPLYQRALEIIMETWGLEHPIARMVRKSYEDLMKRMEDEKD